MVVLQPGDRIDRSTALGPYSRWYAHICQALPPTGSSELRDLPTCRPPAQWGFSDCAQENGLRLAAISVLCLHRPLACSFGPIPWPFRLHGVQEVGGSSPLAPINLQGCDCPGFRTVAKGERLLPVSPFLLRPDRETNNSRSLQCRCDPSASVRSADRGRLSDSSSRTCSADASARGPAYPPAPDTGETAASSRPGTSAGDPSVFPGF